MRSSVAVARAARWLLRHFERDDAEELPTRVLELRDELVTRLGRRWLIALAAAVGRWALDFAALAAALAAVSDDTRLSLVLLAYVGAQLLAQVPITPGGLGVVEAGLSGLLIVAGVSASAAAVATLAYRLVSYWLMLPAGLGGWVVARFSTSSLTPDPEPAALAPDGPGAPAAPPGRSGDPPASGSG